MNKKEIKGILISMRTPANESLVNKLLSKIDLIPEDKLLDMAREVGDNEESIRKYFEEKISERQNHRHEEHTPINKMFTYGVAGKSVHLHMPVDLHEMMSKIGLKKTFDTVNLQLLDAIEKVRAMQKDGFYKLKDIDSIYMISPILVGREMKFLEGLDFETQTYRKKELQDAEFVRNHPEARLATHIFGNDKNVGTARISLDKLNSEEWQEKRKKKVKEYAEKGITLSDTEQSK